MLNFITKKSYLLLLSSVICLVSCDDSDSDTVSDSVSIPDDSGSEGIDSRLQPFVNNFVADMNERGITRDISGLSVSFSSLDSGVAGICSPSEGRVVISPIFINDSRNLEELIYHELGHCVLGMEHRSNSIMQSSGFVGLSEVSINEFFNEEFFFEFDVNTSSVIEVKYFE